AILFDSKSDSKALNALKALKPSILLPNSGGENIFLIGHLSERTFHTSSSPNAAESEPYRSFRLDGWFIKIPFIEIRTEDGQEVPKDSDKIKHSFLEKTDFQSTKNFNPQVSDFDPS